MRPIKGFSSSVGIFAMAGLILSCTAQDSSGTTQTGGDALPATSCDLESAVEGAGQRRIQTLIQSARGAGALTDVNIDYPLDESIFPPDMIAPTFLWHDTDETADRWLVEVSFAGDASPLCILVPGLPRPEGEIDSQAMSNTNEVYEYPPYEASARAWKPNAETWATLKKHSVAGPAQVAFFGYRQDDPQRVVSRGSMTLSTSRDPVGAPIFYRDVPLMGIPNTKKAIMPLPKEVLPIIVWRWRDISLPVSRVVMKDMPTCSNCHSFSADGETIGMDIDGPSGDKGAYAFASIEPQMTIEDNEIITWNSFEDKPEGHNTLGFMSRVSPDGQTALSTVNESIYAANFPDYKFGQVFYPTRGILAYYSRKTGKIRALPGADDRDHVHTDGVWTPDGKSIIFARGTAGEPYLPNRPLAKYAGDPNETPMLYDLYRIPFNEGQGGQPEPIAGASNNGMSNNFPKVSPDGKWIVFVRCRNGQLMRPDSKLWIMPATGGEARLMRCNTSLMNSWHSFSPNGRWMVFSSKSNTPYTQLFLTHIDEEGNDSPALLIENSTAANRASNIPEFANLAYDDLLSITVPQVDFYKDYHRGSELATEGRFQESIVEFEKALAVATDSRIHGDLAKVLMNLGENDRALHHLRESLKLNPYNYEVFNNLATILFDQGELDKARQHLDSAIRLYPHQPRAWSNRGMVDLQLGHHADAIENFTETIRQAPRYADAYSGRGMVFKAIQDYPRALSDFDRAIELRPQAPTAWYFRALIRAETGDLNGALQDVTTARQVAPPDSPQIRDIENLRRRLAAQLNPGS